MRTLTKTIRERISTLPEGAVLHPKEFLHLGTRAAIDQALSRLCHQGQLTRIARGSYVKPVSGRFGVRAPALEKVLASLEEKTGEVVVPNGAAAANALGLSTQVPVRSLFLTSGRSRKLTLGNRMVELQHVPPWQLALGNKPAGAAVRALAWLGPQYANSELVKLQERLPPKEWKELMERRTMLPAWMAKALGQTSKSASNV